MTGALLLRQLRREGRGMRRRFAFFAACLGVGVAAVVSVSGFTSAVEARLMERARPLLGGDLSVESVKPLPAALDAALAAGGALAGARRADVTEMVTVVTAVTTVTTVPSVTAGGSESAAEAPSGAGIGRSQLVELKAVPPSWPLAGEVAVDPPRPLPSLLSPETAVVGPDLLQRLGVAVGGTVTIGGAPFRIAGVVTAEPDRLTGPFSLGPRVLVSPEGLERAGLLRFGSRATRKALLRLPEGTGAEGVRSAAAALRRALRAQPSPEDVDARGGGGGEDGGARRGGEASSGVRVQTYLDAQPAIRQGLGRVDRFLGLVALLSLLVGAVGVALTVRAWLAGRLDSLAVMKCLGMRPRELFALFGAQLLLLGLLAGVAGSLAGTALLYLLPNLLPGFAQLGGPPGLPWGAAGKGLLLGTASALLFGLPVLASALRVPPARVLRRDVEPLPPARAVRFLVVAAVVLGVFALAAAQARSVLLGAQFTGALLAATGVLSLAALATTRGLGRLPRARLPVWARHGLASASRPGAATFGSIVALGLGVLVVLAMALAERNLSKRLLAGLPKDAPTAFFVDVQQDQVDGLRALLAREGATGFDSVPVVSARLTAIDGKRTDRRNDGKGEGEGRRPGGGSERRPGGEERRWALSREQRLTYMEKLPADNRIVEGKLWKDAGPEVSLEEEFARRRLGVGLGAVLTFDVQGVPFDLKVTSLRKVDWRTFGINFFLVVKPGVLDGAPQARLAVARVPAAAEERVQGLAARAFPNVTMIRTREVMEKVGTILAKAGLAVRLLGLFTVVSGIVLLGGAVSASSARRGREAALLKTLGMTRAAVAGLFAAEYALVGLVAGTIGAAGAWLLSREVVVRVFDLAWESEPLLLLATPAATVFLAVVAGLAASAGALSRRPVETLRSE